MIFWDSSALVPLLVDEPDSKLRLKQFGQDPAVAVWWGTPVECESALQRRLREKSILPGQVEEAHELLDRVAGDWLEIPPSPALRQLARRLVRTHPLRAAAALQLAAALTLVEGGLPRLRFATADARLKTAAPIEGLTVL